MNHDTTIIGLGVMGQRMLRNMAGYGGFTPVLAWDPDAEACRRTAERYPHIAIAADARAAIEDARTSVVYIASPPRWHAGHALAAIAVGKAVYCEKPLGVDLVESEQLVDAAEAAGTVNIVNFSLASAVATREVESRLGAGDLGEIVGVEVRVHFSEWPREWQIDAAGWLSYRAEGGFTREVLSHWVYLTERLLGRARLIASAPCYPGATGEAEDAAGDERAETHLVARLEAGGVPVTVAGSVGGAGPDLVEFTLWGTAQSCRVHDWNQLLASTGGTWREQTTGVADAREKGYELQLAQAARAVAGAEHTLPSFRDALSVQRLVEGMLGR